MPAAAVKASSAVNAATIETTVESTTEVAGVMYGAVS
jgi:hypothetical protein